MGRPKSYIEYSAEVAGSIARLRSQGKTLLWICKQRGYPSLDQHYEWIQQFADYRELMEECRKDYASTLFESAVGIADEARSLTDVKRIPALRLAFDALSYAASRSDPARYSPTSQVVNTAVESYVDVLQRISKADSAKLSAKQRPRPKGVPPDGTIHVPLDGTDDGDGALHH
jgi:hypothetical protein